MMKVVVFWFRRDLRLEDNAALSEALATGFPVLPLFIFDTNIIDDLPKDDPRISFIHVQLAKINTTLNAYGSALRCVVGEPEEAIKKLLAEFEIAAVYANKDYEPAAIKRDQEIANLLAESEIPFKLVKDQVIFEENEIVKEDGKPYTVYTPYKRKWRSNFRKELLVERPSDRKDNFLKYDFKFPSLESIGFRPSAIKVKAFSLDELADYDIKRNFPAQDGTSYLGPHLRFGTISIRQVITRILAVNDTFLDELIWREFFMQILFHFPHVVRRSFKPKYDNIPWRNNEAEFQRWCNGQTGYPMVDAGMRQLNATGYMHNRVRMVVASFLIKHLLIDWRWGEAYFAEKLLDYELASNNGNWQWAAGSGCDAAPYFRIFNPTEQIRKFDNQLDYINSWVPELNSLNYPEPMVDHKYAYQRAIQTYKEALTTALS